MEAMRESWTDGRLDDLSHRMDAGFNRVDADLRELRTEMNARFDALQHTLIHVAGGILAAFGAAVVGLIATQL
jgi:hypothetical protein